MNWVWWRWDPRIQCSNTVHTGRKAIVLLAFDTFLAIVNWIQSQFLEQAAENFSKRLKVKIFSALLRQEIGFFYKRDFDQLKFLLDQGDLNNCIASCWKQFSPSLLDTASLCNFFSEDLPDLIDRSASIFSQLFVVWDKRFVWPPKNNNKGDHLTFIVVVSLLRLCLLHSRSSFIYHDWSSSCDQVLTTRRTSLAITPLKVWLFLEISCCSYRNLF